MVLCEESGESGFKLAKQGRMLGSRSCPESFIAGIGCSVQKELLYPQQEFLHLRWCSFPCLLGTWRGEGSEEDDVLKAIPPKGMAFSRKLGLILFSVFLKNSGSAWFWCTPEREM